MAAKKNENLIEVLKKELEGREKELKKDESKTYMEVI